MKFFNHNKTITSTVGTVATVTTKGTTLPELLITLSLLSILSSLAAFPAKTLLDKNESRAISRQLYTHLAFARSAAIDNGKTITLCGSDNGYDCRREWQKTLLIFDDDNRNSRWDSGETLHRRTVFNSNNPIIFKLSRHASYLRYGGDGQAFEFGTINYCGSEIRSIVINRGGRGRRANGSSYHKEENIGCK